jgi:hypothetical protein
VRLSSRKWCRALPVAAAAARHQSMQAWSAHGVPLMAVRAWQVTAQQYAVGEAAHSSCCTLTHPCRAAV